ncbi:DUF1579 domain-containing protein [Pseudoxanthomonas sp. PXM02]|uniref:DUF1579 domain-containing protein n=1 Tax=Pseudoxanthomonas sp. PXM02 TaxID=2769294 RepID=UPI001781B67A|nr:DUF1579 domain-containing protein [Pseudoxanthomonas sp. PXM02]MBD9477654.1 DUF1579 domain-containing protein [Pseudoxanthomonas sp. PXM02]
MRHTSMKLSVAVSALLATIAVFAQEKAPSMTPEMQAQMEAYQKAGTPGIEHGRLAGMAGNYDLTVKSWHAPGAPPSTDPGTATRRMILGNRVMLEEVTSQVMGQPFTGQGLHGFDNVTGKYWGTWNDSMSTGVMLSEGTCDAQLTCTYTGTHHDPVTKKPQTSRMTTRWSDKDTEVFEMYGPGPDGKETKMMEITYKRRP